jgi:hypothetical protein
VIISRKWAMPNKWTFEIKPIFELIKSYHSGKWADPFAGFRSPAMFRNDLNPTIKNLDSYEDGLTFLKNLSSEYFDGAFYDPPYSMRQATECYKSFGKKEMDLSVTSMKYWSSCKDELARIIKPSGHCICCGWNSMGLGKSRGFEMIEVLMVPHGGSRNDTIVTVEIKE